MVIKFIDSDGDPVYINPELVALVATEYSDCEKTDNAIVHVKTGTLCTRVVVNVKPEEAAYLINNVKKSNSRKKAVDGE